MKVAINGFGRIGRMVLRAFLENPRPGIEIVAINDFGDVDSSCHLFQYDSIHGTFPGTISIDGKSVTFRLNDTVLGPVQFLNEARPTSLPWREMRVDLVMECSGRFLKHEEVSQHLIAGAGRVIVSAPCQGADQTVVYGVNHNVIQATDLIISNASCTTNCLAPLVKVLDDYVGIESGYMTTIHAYTSDQRLVDTLHKDLRRARSAPLSIVPSSTGAARSIGLILPNMEGKLEGSALRVPVSNVSVVDLSFLSQKDVCIETLHKNFQHICAQPVEEGGLKGILSINEKPLVSSDFNHNPHSSIIDTTQTQVLQKRFVRILSWYDNEWGFSNRMCDLTTYLNALSSV